MPDDDTRVIQVSNLSPTVTKEQMKTLFGFIGKIDEIRLYPEESTDVLSRVCFVKFRDYEDVGVSLHLTNTVFVDRPLIVVPVHDGKIPEESAALGLINNPDVHDPSTMYMGLAQYPALPASTELSKVEEIRRTVYVSNIDTAVSSEALMQFFGHAGEVKYVRMAGDETQLTRSAFVEYTDQVSVVKALSLNGQLFAGRQVRVTPSNNAIVKPVAPGLNATSREIEEAMRKVNEAQSLITAAVDPDANGRRSRSKSRSSRHRSSRSHRSRSRRRSRSKSKRSRSRRRSGSRSYKGSRSRRHSRSRSHKRSPSPRRRKSRSRSKEKDRKRHRSRSRSPRPAKSKNSSSRSGRKRSHSGSRGKARDSASKKSKSRSHSPTIPKLGKEGSNMSEHSSKKQKVSPEESGSKKEVSRKRSKSPKRSPRKSRSKSKSPRNSSRKEKTRYSSRDVERKGSVSDKGRDRERNQDRDSKPDRARDGRREKDRSPEKRRESNKDRDGKRERDRSRERNRSRDRHDEGDSKSSRHREKGSECVAEEKSKKVRRDYDEEEKSYAVSSHEEKPTKSVESEEDQSEQDEPLPSRKNDDSAPVDTNLARMDMDVDSE